MFAPAPLKRDLIPSLAMIWRPASKDDLYLTAYRENLLVDDFFSLLDHPWYSTHLA